jgi:hypothetical protein
MKLVKSLALVIGLICVAYFVGATAYQFTLDSDHNGTAEFSVESTGNTTIEGSLTANGSVAIHDILTISGDTATEAVRIAGAYTTLPTSGYDKYTIIMFIGDDTGFGSPKLCVSTDTVTSASCWVPLH